MQLTEIRINLCPGPHGSQSTPNSHAPSHAHGGNRLRAFCSLTFDNTFVVRDVKLIEGDDGLFLAMPSRKLCDHCPACGEKNHLRARFCNACGLRLDEDRSLRHAASHGPASHGPGASAPRVKLHADIAHPINAECRRRIVEQVIQAWRREVERSRQPGYVPPSLDGEDYDPYDAAPGRPGEAARSPATPSPLQPHRGAWPHQA